MFLYRALGLDTACKTEDTESDQATNNSLFSGILDGKICWWFNWEQNITFKLLSLLNIIIAKGQWKSKSAYISYFNRYN